MSKSPILQPISSDPAPHPQKGVVLLASSKERSWGEDIVVERFYHPAGEHVYGSSSSHLICLHMGRSIHLEQVRDGRTHSGIMARGGLHILPAGVEGTWRHGTDSDHLNVKLTTSFMQRVAAGLNYQYPELQNFFHVRDPRLEHICLVLSTELTVTSSPGRLYIESLATSLAALLLHSYANSSHPSKISKGLPPSLLQKVTSVIEERLAEDLGLAELASEVGLSPAHFSSLFRNSTGLSPHQYVVRRRLERAQNLLKATRLSVGEVAYATGFYDHSHLVRHMKRVMGVTPGYFRDH